MSSSSQPQRYKLTAELQGYLPYRSGSRVQMHRAIRETGSARCYYLRDGRKVSFSVEGENPVVRAANLALGALHEPLNTVRTCKRSPAVFRPWFMRFSHP